MKRKIEQHACSVAQFNQLLNEAKKFFMWREEYFLTKKPWTEITSDKLFVTTELPAVSKGLFLCYFYCVWLCITINDILSFIMTGLSL